MDARDFAEFYGHYQDHCIRAGVEPLTPEATLARLAGWHSTGPCSAMQIQRGEAAFRYPGLTH